MKRTFGLSVENESPGVSSGTKTWSVGTLTYDRQALVILFFWLMWNDFSITVLEQIGGLNGFLMKDHGATYAQMQLLGSLGILLFWLNPWVSTWSDRHRGPLGRRRPFLFFATPFFAFFMGCYPYVPTIYHQMQHHPLVAAIVHHLPVHMNGEVFFMGVCGFISSIFNGVVLAIFSYLYWDVVPETLMGRFQSMSGIVVRFAGLFWNFCIFGYGETHSKTVYVGTAFFCLLAYLLSVWRIKEGKYPPPDSHEKLEAAEPIKVGKFIIRLPLIIEIWAKVAPIRAYFAECFSQAFYLWIFLAMFLYQMGNQGGGYQGFYLRYDLNLPLFDLGWANGMASTITTVFGVTCGFFVGTLTDKIKPVRFMGPIFVIHSLVCYAGFFFVRGIDSFMIFLAVRSIIGFCQGVAFGAFQVELFPREKIGQFCSAQAASYQLLIALLGYFIGSFFDYVHDNRFGFLWMAMFYGLAALCYFKVYINWSRRHGKVPVPHAA